MNAAVSSPGKNILLVDDDPAVRESVRLLLSIDRHTVTEAANGQEALQLFAGSRYDLVITDYLMPEMLGDELAKNIRSIAPAQPILLVTGYLDQLADAGKSADAVLGKPLSVEDLRRAMARPTDTTPSLAAVSRSQPVEFSRSDLLNRASATTRILNEILLARGPVRALRHWGINE